MVKKIKYWLARVRVFFFGEPPVEFGPFVDDTRYLDVTSEMREAQRKRRAANPKGKPAHKKAKARK